MNIIDAFKKSEHSDTIYNANYRISYNRACEPYGKDYVIFKSYLSGLDIKLLMDDSWVVIHETKETKAMETYYPCKCGETFIVSVRKADK